MQNLLDKFIQNEKKAKLWAALSLLAFCTVATTVMVVSYQLKNGKDTSEVPATHDTVFVSKEDTTIAALLNQQAKTIGDFKDSVSILQAKYETQLVEVDRYKTLWEKCESKPPGGGDPVIVDPPKAEPVSVMIYTVRVSKATIEKITELIKKSGAAKNGITINTSQAPFNDKAELMIKQNPNITLKKAPDQQGKQSTKTMTMQQPPKFYFGIKYFDAKFADEAQVIANELNGNGNLFTNWQFLRVKNDVLTAKADIEIWLVGLSVITPIY